MINISEIVREIEQFSPKAYQESYDNARLIVGNPSKECTGVLLTLDSTEAVVDEAIELGVNLIIAHHPIVFKGLKSFTGANYVERTIMKAIKHDVSIYACHTNLDNQLAGVNAKICEKIGLTNLKILAPKSNTLFHLVTFAPKKEADIVREAMFKAGAGHIGNYDYCSFNVEGVGTYRANEQANPSIGHIGEIHEEPETRIEVIVPIHLKHSVLSALKQAHSYEEVAYFLTEIVNEHQEIGSGMVGELEVETKSIEFLNKLKTTMNTKCIRHTNLVNKTIKRVAVCGGAGSFLLPYAKRVKADLFITSDYKYHEFFDAEDEIIIADIGHFESEQFTNEIFAEIITKKYSNFAVHFSKIDTNPINYL